MNFFKKLFGNKSEENKTDNSSSSNYQPVEKFGEGMYRAQGNYDKRAADFMGRGAVNYRVGNFEQAINYYDIALRIEPNYAAAYSNKGNALAALGRYEEAMYCFDKSIAIHPMEPQYYYNKASTLMGLNRYSEAKECYLKALELDSGLTDAMNNLAICYLHEQDFVNSYIWLNKLLKIQPDDIDAIANMINVLYETGRVEEAEQLYRSAAIKYQDEDIIRTKPEHIAKTGNLSAAIAVYDDLYNRTGDIEIIRCKANFLYNKDVLSAIEAYEKYLSVNPTRIDAWGYKSNLHATLNDFETQLFCLGKILEIDPNEYMALYQKFIALYNMGRKEEALKINLQILDTYPTEIEVLNKLITLLGEIRTLEEGLKILDGCIEKCPDNRYNIVYRKGILHMGFKQYDKAVEIFEGLNREMKFAWNYYQIGIINNIKGNTMECLEYLEKTFNLDQSLVEDAKNFPGLDNLRDNQEFIKLLDSKTKSAPVINEAGIGIVEVFEGGHGDNFAALFGYDYLKKDENKNTAIFHMAYIKTLPVLKTNNGVTLQEGDLTWIGANTDVIKIRGMESGDFYTGIPVLSTKRKITVTTKTIYEWAHFGKIEAEIYGGNPDQHFGLGFFATDYGVNKNVYQLNKALEIRLSAFALSLDEGYEKTVWGPTIADDFAGYLPYKLIPGVCYYSFVCNVIDFKAIRISEDQKGYILTIPLINDGEGYKLIVEMFVNPENMGFSTLKKGMRVSGVLWFQGEVAG